MKGETKRGKLTCADAREGMMIEHYINSCLLEHVKATDLATNRGKALPTSPSFGKIMHLPTRLVRPERTAPSRCPPGLRQPKSPTGYEPYSSPHQLYDQRHLG